MVTLSKKPQKRKTQLKKIRDDRKRKTIDKQIARLKCPTAVRLKAARVEIQKMKKENKSLRWNLQNYASKAKEKDAKLSFFTDGYKKHLKQILEKKNKAEDDNKSLRDDIRELKKRLAVRADEHSWAGWWWDRMSFQARRDAKNVWWKRQAAQKKRYQSRESRYMRDACATNDD
eukprot:TRINITY_DN51315_c0_g1_i1.p1 TRINITY_DN51315_c0_g1~~TRINITY_DN51315_c0_g1_i1.p1  ORF type:complete len:174 (-),score=35.78 TRINITY_DN51315_c0_g1_i1:64-585(-)